MIPNTIRRKMKISPLVKRTRRRVRAVMMMTRTSMMRMMRRRRRTRTKMGLPGRRPSEWESGEG